jgi:hydroxyethylthiazole kinase
MDLVQTIADDLAIIREKRPLVHSITNFVVMNETANATLCIGALPIMSHAVEEVEEMVRLAGALVLNIGTLTPDWVEAMALAGKQANASGIPVILDPVGAGATVLRTTASKRLLQDIKVSIVRGNAGEVASLAGIAAEVRGVEHIDASESAETIAREFARVSGCTVAITGVVDVVSDGTRMVRISNGHAMLNTVVGTGCMSNVIVGAFAAVQRDPFVAAVGGLTAFGIAGQIAAHDTGDRPGTFHAVLYDTLYSLAPEDIRSLAKIELVE